jgi:hypothetical protein
MSCKNAVYLKILRGSKYYVGEFVKNNLHSPFGKFQTFRKVFKKQAGKLYFTNSLKSSFYKKKGEKGRKNNKLKFKK